MAHVELSEIEAINRRVGSLNRRLGVLSLSAFLIAYIASEAPALGAGNMAKCQRRRSGSMIGSRPREEGWRGDADGGGVGQGAKGLSISDVVMTESQSTGT
jgi:hypothetical protein